MLGIFARSFQTATRTARPAHDHARSRAALEMESRRQTLFLGRPVLPSSERRE